MLNDVLDDSLYNFQVKIFYDLLNLIFIKNNEDIMNKIMKAQFNKLYLLKLIIIQINECI